VGSVVGSLLPAFIVVSMSALSSSHSFSEFAGTWIGEYVLGASTALFATLLYGAPAYFPLLLLWPFVAQPFPRLELERGPFVIAMFFLSLPAAVGALAVANHHGIRVSGGVSRDDVEFAISCFVVAWTGLVIPRLWLHRLRLGVFINR
jgi:hypothetical protein